MSRPAVPESMTPQEAAAFWLVRQDRGLDRIDEARFQTWLEASPEHEAAWSRARGIWAALPAHDAPELDVMRRAALTMRPPRRPPLWMAAAAVLAIAVISGASWRYLVDGDARVERVATAIASSDRPDYATAIGVQKTVILADGTRVLLDTDTALVVRIGAGQRAARLIRGRAYFTVAHEAAAPFALAVGDRIVTDVGTEFAAQVGSRVEVALVKGRVTVVGHGRRMTLKPGQRLSAAGERTEAVAPFDPEVDLAWRQGFVDFRDETLANAFAEMNRYGRQQVKVRDAATGALRVSGHFRLGDPARFAETLATIYPVRLVDGPDGREIRLIR